MAHSDAVDDPISFEAVSSACTDSLPNGDACSLAWEKLENIYAMKSTTKKGELKAEFFATKLKAATSDPDTKMELIKAKLKLDYAYEIDQENYIKHILDSLPAWFDATIEFMHKDLNSYEFLDLEEVNEQIRVRHSSLQSKGD